MVEAMEILEMYCDLLLARYDYDILKLPYGAFFVICLDIFQLVQFLKVIGVQLIIFLYDVSLFYNV